MLKKGIWHNAHTLCLCFFWHRHNYAYAIVPFQTLNKEANILYRLAKLDECVFFLIFLKTAKRNS